ncbi:hypothetical protein PM082_019357 [Marasmius tenuissimus]|nr:hypothetical protein PM082_019357 [Marasmius tenuissimus]
MERAGGLIIQSLKFQGNARQMGVGASRPQDHCKTPDFPAEFAAFRDSPYWYLDRTATAVQVKLKPKSRSGSFKRERDVPWDILFSV